MNPYLFVFKDEEAAKRFVARLAHYVHDVAIYRDGINVSVIDGSEKDQRERIYEIYRTSDATFVLPVPRKS